MREYWVYELRAGDWLYIGMTSNVKNRLIQHRCAIRKQGKPALWNRALSEYPIPEDWEMTAVAGPFLTKEEAVSEEERLQRKLFEYPGRLWNKCGDAQSDETKEKVSVALIGKMTGEDNPFHGKTHTDEAREKIALARKGKTSNRKGKTNSPKTIAKMKDAAKLREAKKRAQRFFAWLSEPIT